MTTIIQSGTEATVQVSYWIVDGTPDAEAVQLPPEDPRHYQYRGTKTALQTAVKLRPDIALGDEPARRAHKPARGSPRHLQAAERNAESDAAVLTG